MMDRADAVRLIGELNALADPARGGTEGERATARLKADRIAKRFGLGSHERKTTRPQMPRRSFVASPTETWDFDISTGKHSPNVTVHRYESPYNWKIEVFPSGPRPNLFGRKR